MLWRHRQGQGSQIIPYSWVAIIWKIIPRSLSAVGAARAMRFIHEPCIKLLAWKLYDSSGPGLAGWLHGAFLCGRANKRGAVRPSLCRRQTPLKDRPFHICSENMASMEMERRPCGLFTLGIALDRICSRVCFMRVAIFASEFYLPDGNFYAPHVSGILPVLWCPFFDDGWMESAACALNWPLFRFSPGTRALTQIPAKRPTQSNKKTRDSSLDYILVFCNKNNSLPTFG